MKFNVLALTFCAVFLLCGPAQAEKRVAMVIGNGAYLNAPRLLTPLNDAADVAASLRRAGFEVILATDLDKIAMDAATIQFAKAARVSDVAMFYYSGHALQFGGVNYLAPVDAKLTDEADLRRMVRIDEIVSDLQQAKNLRVLVLDSCRDNPLADQLKRSIGTTRALPLQNGLAKIDSPQGMIVAYATQAGRTAEDGTGRNSPYTAAFLKNIDAQEEIGTIFRRISADVYETTRRTQLPELSLSLIGEFYLHGKTDFVTSQNTSAADAVRSDFEAAQNVNTAVGWNTFLSMHPVGLYAELAKESRARIASLNPDALPTAPETTIGSKSTLADTGVPKMLQAELQRVGCSTGALDEVWGGPAQKALELFNKNAGTKFSVKLASVEALDAVRSRVGRVCPLFCEHGYKADHEKCSKIVCEPGLELGDDNTCHRIDRRNTATDMVKQRKPDASSKSAHAWVLAMRRCMREHNVYRAKQQGGDPIATEADYLACVDRFRRSN
jgi:hypothetical protein